MTEEASERLKVYGRNEVAHEQSSGAGSAFAAFNNPFIYVLMTLAGVKARITDYWLPLRRGEETYPLALIILDDGQFERAIAFLAAASH